jgi:ribosomal protein L7Ae-like RNA K-turn-binding protein
MNNQLLSFLGITRKSGNIVFGMDPVKKDLVKGKIKLILITSDISKNSLKEIQSAAKNVRITQIGNTKDDLNSAVGKYSAVIGILDRNFAEKISVLANNTVNSEATKSTRENNREECNL